MKLSFRWYGENDPVKLEQIKQIPNMKGGVVTAIYDISPGEIWPYNKIKSLVDEIEKHGLTFEVVESLPVHEDIKMGLPTRDKYISNYIESLRNLKKAGIKVVTYNFMPIWDWLRTTINYKLNDGSYTLFYDDKVYKKIMDEGKKYNNFSEWWNKSLKNYKLPGWDSSYDDSEMLDIFNFYKNIDQEQLWNNLEYFIKAIMPTADELDIKMAIHPDDPPWSVFNVPRIITSKNNLKRFLGLYDSKNHGLALCTASLGSSKDNDPVDIVKTFIDRIHFAHMRNLKYTNEKDRSFIEVSHNYRDGSIDMTSIAKAYIDGGFTGYIRPDHGRNIWGENGRPGYGLFDRALGATYINGIFDGIMKEKGLIKSFRKEKNE